MVKIVCKIPALLISGMIWFLSSQSVLPTPKGILGFDKVQHLLAYGVFAGTLGLWFSRRQWKRSPVRCMVWVIIIAATYGISDEIHQSFVPGRDGNVWDWLADTLGAIIGAGLVMVSVRKLEPAPPAA
ncbi:MAG: VanZ family protein [Treponema sp.]|nr:VanZ family protein [Treponema sp.]